MVNIPQKIDKRHNRLNDEFAANEFIMEDVEHQEHVHSATSVSQVSSPLIIAASQTKSD